MCERGVSYFPMRQFFIISHLTKIVRGISMAEPIDPGLVLEGEDAENFIQYMKHPTYTPCHYKKSPKHHGLSWG